MGSFRGGYHKQAWYILVLLCLVEICSTVAERNFITVNTLPDGEIETRIQYRRISAKETTVGKGSPTGIKFRQIVRGRNFLQLIYDGDNTLRDCEYLHNKNQARRFLLKFNSDISNLIATSNVSIETIEDKKIPSHVQSVLNYKSLKRDCQKLHNELRTQAESSIDIKSSDMEDDNPRLSRARNRRSVFIVPGTQWCGLSHNAETYTQLGVLSRTDKCCRRHDNCKADILAFKTRFHFFNSNPYTLSHCFCDESFRACLKMVGTSDANLVGRIFFNVVQTQCFVLKAKKKCVKRSWWGKCERHKFLKHAVLRDNLYY